VASDANQTTAGLSPARRVSLDTYDWESGRRLPMEGHYGNLSDEHILQGVAEWLARRRSGNLTERELRIRFEPDSAP